MNRAQTLDQLRQHWPEIATFGVRHLAIFGSVARDEAGPKSDVDLLVEFEPPTEYRRYFALHTYLETLLDRRVDLATPARLRPHWREQVAQEALRVA